jgi:hypothetical protein
MWFPDNDCTWSRALAFTSGSQPMSDSERRRINIGGVQWLASRPGILAVLKDIKFLQSFGLLVEFCGTESELIAAQVATPETFHNPGKNGQRFRYDGHGDQYTVERRGAKWDLKLFISAWGSHSIPCDDRPRGDEPWWTVHGAVASTVTAEILAKLMRD